MNLARPGPQIAWLLRLLGAFFVFRLLEYAYFGEKDPKCLVAVPRFTRRHVFIDLGANNGDSLRAFLGDPTLRWHFEFPRPCFVRYTDFEMILVEANPKMDAPLSEMKEKMAKQGIKVEIVNRTVVGTRDGPTSFEVDNRSDENCNSCVG